MYRSWLFTFLTLLLLWTIIAQVNHYLAVWHMYAFVGALYVTFSALRLPPRAGAIATVLGGLLCDGNAPVPFGTHVLLFIAAYVLIQNARGRIPVDQTITQVVIALLTNLGLYLAFAIFMAVHQPAPGTRWPRMLMDLLVSQVLLVVIAPWFFALQTRVLAWANIREQNRF
jgi:rod shape-determining protein MreD